MPKKMDKKFNYISELNSKKPILKRFFFLCENKVFKTVTEYTMYVQYIRRHDV